MKVVHHKDGDPRNNTLSNLELRTMPNHTPTPWRLDRSMAHGKEFVRVADCSVIAPQAKVPPGLPEANAAFIVRAVNNHDALVELLQSIVAQDEFTGATPDNLPLFQAYAILNDWRDRAGELLAKAKES